MELASISLAALSALSWLRWLMIFSSWLLSWMSKSSSFPIFCNAACSHAKSLIEILHENWMAISVSRASQEQRICLMRVNCCSSGQQHGTENRGYTCEVLCCVVQFDSPKLLASNLPSSVGNSCSHSADWVLLGDSRAFMSSSKEAMDIRSKWLLGSFCMGVSSQGHNVNSIRQ